MSKGKVDPSKQPFKVQVTLRSLSPALFDRMDDQILLDMLADIKRKKDTETPILERARKKLYREFGDEGDIGFPAENFFACYVEAGRHIKYDTKKFISTKDSSLLPAMLSIDEEFIIFKVTTPKDVFKKVKREDRMDQKEGWVVDIRKGNLKTTSGSVAVPVVRPKIHQWEATMTLTLDLVGHSVNEDKIKDLIYKAGNMIGIAAYRPSCRGTFGRFEIADWKVLGPVEKAKAA